MSSRVIAAAVSWGPMYPMMKEMQPSSTMTASVAVRIRWIFSLFRIFRRYRISHLRKN